MRTKAFHLHCHKMVHSDLATNLTCSSASKRFILRLVKYLPQMQSSLRELPLQPRGYKTFQDYAENSFIPYQQTEVRNAKRLDIASSCFLAMNREIDNIPPTAASLVEHTKRAVLQANVWYQIDRKETNELDLASFGWRVIERKWKSHWSDLPKVSSMSTPFHEDTLIETINGYL